MLLALLVTASARWRGGELRQGSHLLTQTPLTPTSTTPTPPTPPAPPAPSAHPGQQNATELYFTQYIDHFNLNVPIPTATTTYKQRYFIYDKYWKNKSGPIFFYCGNEADVGLYVNATGFMWENGQSFGALLVWAEHRYYGNSLPFGAQSSRHLGWMTHEQALADYVALIRHIKSTSGAEKAKVIAFGGSYGGMLAAWIRYKYPHVIHGALAASAPIAAFGNWDNNSYWRVVTHDTTPEAGAAQGCTDLVRSAFAAIFELGKTEAGRRDLAAQMSMCSPPKDADEVRQLAVFMQMAWDNMAMGNFPFPSNYLTGGGPLLPPWPVRVACDKTITTFKATGSLLTALSAGSAVFNNATSDQKCYTLPEDDQYDGNWDYMWCTAMMPQETYFSTNGKSDMFWPNTITMDMISKHCTGKYGPNVDPRRYWILDSYGSPPLPGVSNIIFSNGLLDPWSAGGVVTSSPGVTVILIKDGAHHVDLMFSDPQDPPSIINARKEEIRIIQSWL